MREKLISYVNLLFAGNEDCDEIRQEILQNTLDRFDDLVAEGKPAEAAYRLAIGGIGDINEILGQESAPTRRDASPAPSAEGYQRRDTPVKKALRAVAVALYILCPLPLLALAETGLEVYGVCGLLTFVAVATALMMLGSPSKVPPEESPAPKVSSPNQALWNILHTLIEVLTLVAYFLVSFVTRAWHITWLIFVIGCALNGLVKAILVLKECVRHEN